MDPSSDYKPLNSHAASVFFDIFAANSLNIAFMTMIVYDYITTLDKEVERLWTLNWRLPKILFLINRYFVPPLLCMVIIAGLIFPLSLELSVNYSCGIVAPLSVVVQICSITTAQAVIIIRLCAIYAHNKIFTWVLVTFLAAEICVIIALYVMFLRQSYAFRWYYGMPGCAYMEPGLVYIVWLPFVIIDGLLLLLMLYKIISSRGNMNTTITVLARDSILYFLLVFGAVITALVPESLGSTFNFNLPSQAIACMGVSHMMMNIRGLVFDDPNHTAHLQSLVLEAMGPIDGAQEEIEMEEVV